MLKKLTFVYTTTSTLYSFNRFDNFGLFSWIEVCCFWRGNNNAFINTDGLEIIFYRHSDGSHLCLQACSTWTNQTVKWWTNFFEWKKLNFIFFSKCSIQMNVPFHCNLSAENIKVRNIFLSQITNCS